MIRGSIADRQCNHSPLISATQDDRNHHGITRPEESEGRKDPYHSPECDGPVDKRIIAIRGNGGSVTVYGLKSPHGAKLQVQSLVSGRKSVEHVVITIDQLHFQGVGGSGDQWRRKPVQVGNDLAKLPGTHGDRSGASGDSPIADLEKSAPRTVRKVLHGSGRTSERRRES